MDENRDVREAYALFVAQLTKLFKERKVNPRDIQSTVCNYGIAEVHQHEPKVFDFRRDDSISDVFFELSQHCTWFNYDLFHVIVNILGDESERKCLNKYEDEHLIPYLKRSIFEIPCAPLHAQSQRTELLLKVSADLVITGGEVKAVQRNLAKLLGFKSSTLLRFENYNKGCIELVFSLPTVIFEKSSPGSKLFTNIEWDKLRQSYRFIVGLANVLLYSEKPEVSLLVKLLQEKEDALNELLEREKTKQIAHSIDREGLQDQSLTNTLSEKLKVSEKISKAKTLEIENLTRHKETTDKILVEKQEEIEVLQMETKSLKAKLMRREESGISQLMEKMKNPRICDTKLKKIISYEFKLQKEVQSLQEIITSLTLQIREKEERNVYLTENIKDLQSQILEVRDLLKTCHPLLNQKLEEPLHSKQEDTDDYELFDRMKTLENFTFTIQEREITDKHEEITKLQEMITLLTLQLTEKDKIITQLRTKDKDEEDSQQESSDVGLPSKLPYNFSNVKNM